VWSVNQHLVHVASHAWRSLSRPLQLSPATLRLFMTQVLSTE
jgi:hypothetical protein